MGYCFMTMQKIKNLGQLSSKYNHNCRTVDVENADVTLSHLNEDLVPLPVEDGKVLNYVEAVKDRIENLDYYKNEGHKIRKNAVLAMEIVTTFSRADNINIDAWKKQNVDWLNKTFNVAPDKKRNVLHVTYHADEAGNVHCHALVVPIDQRGRLCARSFFNGSRQMSILQDSYAKKMKPLGLERGLKGSSAKHKDIRKMYADLNKALDIPKPRKGESAAEYYERVSLDVKTAYAASKKNVDDYQNERRRNADEYIINLNKKNKDKLNRFNSMLNKAKEEIKSLAKLKKNYEKDIDDLKAQVNDYDKLLSESYQYEKFNQGLQLLKEESFEDYDKLVQDVDYCLHLAEEYEYEKSSRP